MKALIPAAGLAKRWHPWSYVVPKELLPLGRYPAIHYVLEEAVSAGIKEIGVIIREDKEVIRRYIEKCWQVNRPEIFITWFYQSLTHGVAGALFCAKDWVRDGPTAILYPDEIHPSKGGIIELRMAYENSPGCWLGLTKRKQNRRQAVFQIQKVKGNVFRVSAFSSEKGAQRAGYGTGRYILGSGLEYLSNFFFQTELREREELDDINVLSPLWDRGIQGIMLDEPIFDLGTPINWFHSITKLYQAHKEFYYV